MNVKGVMGSASFDDGWVTITKKELGKQDRNVRIRATDVTGTQIKLATRLFHGYIQFVLPGSLPATERKGMSFGSRPPHSDPHSLSIPHKSNGAAEKLMAAIEQARLNP